MFDFAGLFYFFKMVSLYTYPLRKFLYKGWVSYKKSDNERSNKKHLLVIQ